MFLNANRVASVLEWYDIEHTVHIVQTKKRLSHLHRQTDIKTRTTTSTTTASSQHSIEVTTYDRHLAAPWLCSTKLLN